MKKFLPSFLIFTLLLTTVPAQTLAQQVEEGAATAAASTELAIGSGQVETIPTANLTEVQTQLEINDPATDDTMNSLEPESASQGATDSAAQKSDGESSNDSTADKSTDEKDTEDQPSTEPELQSPLPKPTNGDIDPPVLDVDPVPTTGFATDPKSFLSSFQGKADVSLFSGALNYQFPLWVPQGRGNMTPQVALSYSSSDSRYASPIGQGWSLPTNAIYRVQRDGVDKMYEQNDYFGADVFGSQHQLMIYDANSEHYKPKHQGEGIDFMYNDQENSWEMKDARGASYTFGTVDDTRQTHPNDANKTYKWMLERVEDVNGNFMTLTYAQHENAVYPETIRWTGHGNDEGLFEMRFELEDRPAYRDYKTGFGVTHAKRVDQIDLYSYESGNAELKLSYQLDYDEVNSAISLLRSIETEAQGMALPGTYFEYFNGTENTEDKKLHALKEIETLYGAKYRYSYTPASAYRYNNGTASNWIPFTSHTVKTQSVQARPGDLEYTTTYDYRDGHYYFDDLDAYKREYAGFGKVSVTDPEDNKKVLYFHQSEFDPNNADNALLGEFEDHIGKKGRMYRQEHYDSGPVLMREVISKWDRDTSLNQGDSPQERGRIFLAQKVMVDHGQGESKAKASTYESNAYGSPTHTLDYGQVDLLDATGAFNDSGQDRIEAHYDYVENEDQHVFSVLSQYILRDMNDDLLAKTQLSYDGLNWGQVERGHWTFRQDWVTDQETMDQTRVVNNLGLMEEMTNSRDYTTTLTYDEFDLYPKTVTNAKDHTNTFVYDPFFGKVLQSSDANGFTQSQSMDVFGRIESRWVEVEEGQMAMTDAYHYQMPGDPVSIEHTRLTGLSDSNNNNIEVKTITYLDGLGRPLQTKQEAEGDQYISVNQRYNSLGQLEATTLPVFSNTPNFEEFDDNAPKTTLTYDGLGRPLSRTTPVGTMSTTYGAWTQTVSDANGNEKAFESDARGNLVKVTEYLDNQPLETVYDYNASNQLIGMSDAEGNVRSITYDLLGRRLSQTLLHHPNNNDPGTYSFTYDENGNLATRTDAKGNTTTYAYDELDRLTSDEAGGEKFTLTYDKGANGLGRLSAVQGPDLKKRFEYDLMGRLILENQKLKTGSYQTQFHYSGSGAELTHMTYPNSLEVHYRYNNAGQLEQVPGYVDDFDYAPHGALAQIDYANGVSTTNTYEPAEAYRLVSRLTSGEDDLQDLSYQFDPVGNILQITENAPTHLTRTATYTYDDLDRLITADITGTPNPDMNLTFTYSDTGNILNKSNVGDYEYNDTHPQAVTQVEEQNYAYDANGSLIASPGFTHGYNARNQLTLSENEQEIKTAYFYNESAQRLYKATKAGITTYVNDLFEDDQGTQRAFVMAGNLKLATVQNGEAVFHHPDHLSGASVSTDAGGSVVEQVDYLPYGDSRVEVQEVENDYLYTGQERDEETGLYYYGARYYLSDVGRFASVDPWFGDIKNPQSLNKYSYVLNNPLKYTDPTGAIPDPTDAVVGFCGPFAPACLAVKEGIEIGVGLLVVNRMAQSVTIPQEKIEPSDIPADPPAPGIIVDEAPPAEAGGTLVLPADPPDTQPIVDIAPEADGDTNYILVPPQSTPDSGTCGANMSCASSDGETIIHLPSDPEAAGYVWKGTGEQGVEKGNWVNEETGEKINPDMSHGPPIGPHNDYTDPSGNQWRVYPDGTAIPK